MSPTRRTRVHDRVGGLPSWTVVSVSSPTPPPCTRCAPTWRWCSRWTPTTCRGALAAPRRSADSCWPGPERRWSTAGCRRRRLQHRLRSRPRRRLGAELEPDVPVIGTVPAIRPAAAAGGPLAVWATAATASSAYLRGLVDAFASDTRPTRWPLSASPRRSSRPTPPRRRVHRGRRRPPRPRHPGAGARVHPLRARVEHIAAALGPGVTVFDSPLAVARQTLRRLGLDARPPRAPCGPRGGAGERSAALQPARWAGVRRCRHAQPVRGPRARSGGGEEAMSA